MCRISVVFSVAYFFASQFCSYILQPFLLQRQRQLTLCTPLAKNER